MQDRLFTTTRPFDGDARPICFRNSALVGVVFLPANLVADPEGRIRVLVEACGLTWTDAALRFHEATGPVRTASSSQVRQPIFTTSVARWRRYEAELAPLFAALGPYAPRPRA